MNWLIILIIGMVAGIIVLSGKSLLRQKTREEYLEELAQHLESRLEPLEGYENSYKINFVFSGKTFEFQDIECPGLKTNTYKAYLQTKTKGQLTLTFTERPRSQIKSDIIQSSKIGAGNADTVAVPKELKKFAIYTNNIKMTNQLFADDSFLRILSYYQYVDSRGHPVMPLRIQDGRIALEFDEDVSRDTNLFDLKHNVSKIDAYTKKVVTAVEAIDRLAV